MGVYGHIYSGDVSIYFLDLLTIFPLVNKLESLNISNYTHLCSMQKNYAPHAPNSMNAGIFIPSVRCKTDKHLSSKCSLIRICEILRTDRVQICSIVWLCAV